MDQKQDAAAARAGFGFALTAYAIWGASPLYWLMYQAGPWEIVAHRTLWAALALLPLALARNPRLAGLFTPRRILWALLGALLIGSNWLVFIWAATSGHILETSLGYFIGPLVNVALGVLFLRERLRPIQKAAVLLAFIGVAIPVIAAGRVPVVALYLAVSFSLYAYVRKRLDVDAASGLFLETLLIAPFGLVAIIWLESSGAGHFLQWSWQPLLLVSAGVVFTAGVLLLFIEGARRLRFSTLGLVQFVSPTMGFGAGLALGEAFPPERAAAFVLIWAGVALYIADIVRDGRAEAARRRAASPVG